MIFENPRTRWMIIILTLVTGVLWILPNFVSISEDSFLPHQKITKGLDIQGGLHLVMKANLKKVLSERLTRVGGVVKIDVNESGEKIQSFTVDTMEDGYPVLKIKTTDFKAVDDLVNKNYGDTLQLLSQDEAGANYVYNDVKKTEIGKQTLDQAIEVLRSRIDEFGVAEPNIASQGEERILIQLPGLKDTDQAKKLINRTARLQMAIVSSDKTAAELDALVKSAETKGQFKLGLDAESLSYDDYVERINKDLKSELPPLTELVFQKPRSVESIYVAKDPILIKTDQQVGGELISTAYVGRGQFNEPKISFEMSAEGRSAFGNLTGSNVGEPLSVVLDKVVQQVANIRERISSAGQIDPVGDTREQQFEEATLMSTVLRAGALPVKLEQLEERTVGPTLGAESIRMGAIAGLIGTLLVLLFMMGYYKTLGVIASCALVINILLILAILSSLGATLTLPGIAGIVLTIGMAVDANVIIFERIREELNLGAGIKAAVRNGFDHALSAILDANITTAVVCLVLMYYGSGPIRGFAVTLICGLITSMFTAIFFSRTVMDFLVQRFNLQKL